MIIFKERKRYSNWVRRMLYESLEYTSPTDASAAIAPRLKQAFPRLEIKPHVPHNNLAMFNIISPDFDLRLWWQGLREPNRPYAIFGMGSKVYNASSSDEAISMIKRFVTSWRPPEHILNMKHILAVIATAKSQKGYRFFGFRGDKVKVSVGTILGASANGMGADSILGNSSRLPGTSTIGIPNPSDPKSIALAWRAFSGVAYGKNVSLVGGRSAQAGDDVMDARMGGKNYDVEEYVIKGAEVLVIIESS